MVARLTGLHPSRVRRWLRGYSYTYQASGDSGIQVAHSGPVVGGDDGSDSPYASFLQLVDTLFVKAFLDRGFSLQRVRKAWEETQSLIDVQHFAHRCFFTDGHAIFLEIEGRQEGLLELLSGGQWAIAPIIEQIGERIEFSPQTGFAERWFPSGPFGKVVVDPQVSYGRPSLYGKGVPTDAIYDLYLGESRSVKSVCSWFNLKPADVRAAVEFERRLVA
jgi:uncharacterized protein (DUF433 family)